MWVIARQHPGESMAEWFMEGFLEELTDVHNAFSARALRHAVFYVVPNINPDGSVRGLPCASLPPGFCSKGFFPATLKELLSVQGI